MTAAEPLVRDDADLLAGLGSSLAGLTSQQAAQRLDRSANSLVEPPRLPGWRLLARQLQNPIVLLLIAATTVSMALGEMVDGTIILIITGASVLLGFHQEWGAVRVVEDLLATVRVHADVRRDGSTVEIPLGDVVTGDIVELHAGSVVPGDGRVLVADNVLLDESALTGESYPVAKQPRSPGGTSPKITGAADTGAADTGAAGGRVGDEDAIWCGTHVTSGSGLAVMATVGAATRFGRVAAELTKAHVPTAFEVGLRRFGFLIMRTAGVLVTAILIINVALGRPTIEAVLFSLALAVGLTPQLLPAIVTVTLSRGAREMARRRVIVKRLDAIEDLGAIDVLCTDKTGTITSGEVTLERVLDAAGQPSDTALALAHLNARLQQGFPNPIDAAILAATRSTTDDPDVAGQLIDELPYDFTRKILSVLVHDAGGATLIAKGAFESILSRCRIDTADAAEARRRFERLSDDGLRVLGLATRHYAHQWPTTLSSDDETDLVFSGFVCFGDPPKADASAAIAELGRLGVTTRLITGDNRCAARHAASAVGIDTTTMLTGTELATLSDSDLDARVDTTSLFAEIEPLQKQRIVQALRRAGHAVGYLGDGINDAPSLRVADVGISVDTAVDVAKHSASVVLLDKDLAVLAEGIRQGRRVFANTLKYVQVTLSANFGNMVSMAAAAAFLPFLPLLPRQILLLNFLSDIPGTMIAGDRVDPEAVTDPHGWDIGRIRRFMVAFGLISSVFDITTFVVMRTAFHASATVFHTGWFIESTATELAVMLILRTRRPCYRSRPGTALLVSSIAVAAITVALPYTPLAGDLGLAGPTAALLITLVGITVAYGLATELTKRRLWASTTSPTSRSPKGLR